VHCATRRSPWWRRRAAHRAAIVADVARTGSTEWLTEMAAPGDGDPDLRAAGLAEGESLHVHAADVPDGTGEWLVSQRPGPRSRCAGST